MPRSWPGWSGAWDGEAAGARPRGGGAPGPGGGRGRLGTRSALPHGAGADPDAAAPGRSGRDPAAEPRRSPGGGAARRGPDPRDRHRDRRRPGGPRGPGESRASGRGPLGPAPGSLPERGGASCWSGASGAGGSSKRRPRGLPGHLCPGSHTRKKPRTPFPPCRFWMRSSPSVPSRRSSWAPARRGCCASPGGNGRRKPSVPPASPSTVPVLPDRRPLGVCLLPMPRFDIPSAHVH